MKRVPVDKGMLYFLIKEKRPELAERIKTKGVIETAIIGLGKQGMKHAGLMKDFGTSVTAGISVGREGTRIHEIIPVYGDIKGCLAEHPDIAVASIWRHYSGVKDVAIEVIEAGIPVVVLISEGIPLKDVRDILVAARKKGTILFGGNTPGIIFPPEGIKIGMLPDIFYPEENNDDEYGSKGVTIISRSGAILYHLSDALASEGIAQNAVFGIGGDGAIGTRFVDIVPIVQKYPNTDLVVIAGEIGGCQEELIAEDIANHPEKYPKPVVTLVSGAKAPVGKTMGHAGAIVTPGREYGTYKSKREALEKAGVIVVNSQRGLIAAVKEKLHDKKYFSLERYREKMTKTWEEPPKKAEWATLITKVKPNNLIIAGYPLQDIIEKKTILETAHLLVKGEFPDETTLVELEKIAMKATKLPVPPVEAASGEDISKTIAKYLLLDPEIGKYPEEGRNGPVFKTIFCLGRIAKYMATIFGNDGALNRLAGNSTFSSAIYAALTGGAVADAKEAELLESMIVASVDHGVTPPSAQATVIAATARTTYEVAVAHGVGAITDVHGGAGAKAAEFFLNCVKRSRKSDTPVQKAVQEVMTEYIKSGKRIQGLGHRIHTSDPRREILWKKAEQSGIAGDCVALSKMVTDVFKRVRGITLPINVDGVIGAIIADMGLQVNKAKAVFIFGRVAGLSAHYYEEIYSQPQMRRIDFSNAVYKGKMNRSIE